MSQKLSRKYNNPSIIKFIVLHNLTRMLTKARKPSFTTRIHYQIILDRASMSCRLWKAEQLALLPQTSYLLYYINKASDEPQTRGKISSTSYNCISAPCPVLYPLAPSSHTLSHCQETCSKNPWHLFSKCKEELLQKLKLRTRKYSASETWSRNIWYSSMTRLSVGWEEQMHFWFWTEVNYSVLLNSSFRKLDCTTVTV